MIERYPALKSGCNSGDFYLIAVTADLDAGKVTAKLGWARGKLRDRSYSLYDALERTPLFLVRIPESLQQLSRDFAGTLENEDFLIELYGDTEENQQAIRDADPSQRTQNVVRGTDGGESSSGRTNPNLGQARNRYRRNE